MLQLEEGNESNYSRTFWPFLLEKSGVNLGKMDTQTVGLSTLAFGFFQALHHLQAPSEGWNDAGVNRNGFSAESNLIQQIESAREGYAGRRIPGERSSSMWRWCSMHIHVWS